MFVHINPEINSFGETISTLKFAERVASIELGAARVNKETSEVRDLKEEISKLKSALETKESEVTQLKEYTSRIAVEVKNLRTASPLHLQKHGSNLTPEGTQQLASDARHIESRSCSSGKQRKPRFPSILADKELDSRSPFSAEENHVKSRKQRFPSPSPVTSSLSSDRAAAIKTKSKYQIVDQRLALNLHFPEKASIDKSITNIPTLFSNGSTTTRRVFSEHEEEQFKPTLLIRTFKAESKNADIETGRKIEARKKSDFSETENECNFSPSSYSLREKKLRHHVTRVSQNIEPRTYLQTVESLSSMKHENKPPTTLYRNGKEHSKMTEQEIRRSRSLPRGKFTVP